MFRLTDTNNRQLMFNFDVSNPAPFGETTAQFLPCVVPSASGPPPQLDGEHAPRFFQRVRLLAPEQPVADVHLRRLSRR